MYSCLILLAISQEVKVMVPKTIPIVAAGEEAWAAAARQLAVMAAWNGT